MKTRIKEIYNCEYCNKLYLQKKSCQTHEHYCMKNPANIPKCFGCKFLDETKGDYSHGESFEPKHFFCNKKGNLVHPMKLQRKLDLNLLIDHRVESFAEDSELMPKECDLFENEVIVYEGVPWLN